MRPKCYAALALLTPALLAPPRADATLTLLSSSRSATADAVVSDWSDYLGLPPTNSHVTATSPVVTSTGPYSYSTGTLTASGRAIEVLNHTYIGNTSATSSASFTSSLSPVTGFSATFALTGSVDGWQYAPASNSSQIFYTATFTVDVPTSFTLTAHYHIPSNSPNATAIRGTYGVKVLLSKFSTLNLSDSTAYGISPTTFATSGTFQPGTIYTLHAELDLSDDNLNAAGIGPSTAYSNSGTMDFTLSNLTVLPEPAALPAFAVATLYFARRRTRSNQPATM